MTEIKVSTSILSADFLSFGEEVASIQKAGTDFIHVDVMDGHFVPNLTFGPPLISRLKKITNLPIEVHLMIINAEQVIDDYINTGADLVIVHVEACLHLDRLINYIKSKRCKVGVALNPTTCHSAISYVLEKLDVILVMTVNPGFSGQNFLLSQLEKMQKLKKIIQQKNLDTQIEVDGGIDDQTATLVKKSGANILVSGSYIFKNNNYKKQIINLKNN